MSLMDDPVVMFDVTWPKPEPVTLPAPLPNKPSLETIQEFERLLAKCPQVDIDTSHHFADGVYGREVLIPAGACVTGKIHKGQHLNFLMKGDITVWTEEGMKRLQAPAIIRSEPGTKRVGYAHSDTIWVTVHPNTSNETDLALLESEYIEPETPAIEHGETLCLGSR